MSQVHNASFAPSGLLHPDRTANS